MVVFYVAHVTRIVPINREGHEVLASLEAYHKLYSWKQKKIHSSTALGVV